MRKDVIFIATETGCVEIKGDPVTFHFYKDLTKILGDHPAYKLVPQFFRPLDSRQGLVTYIKPNRRRVTDETSHGTLSAEPESVATESDHSSAEPTPSEGRIRLDPGGWWVDHTDASKDVKP